MSESPTNCLHCEEPLTGNYCAHCGQKATTRRFSAAGFVTYDLLQGIWGVDKGLLFTLKELFSRPGHSIREFIQGKRAGHFNYISLALFIVGLGLFLNEYSVHRLSDIIPDPHKAMASVEKLTIKYPKLLLIVSIPVCSLFSWLWFRRAKLNIAEHLVMNTYKASGELVIELLFTLVTIFYHNKQGLYVVYNITATLTTLYGIWFYIQFFSVYGYSKAGLIIRSILIPASISFFFMLVGLLTTVFIHRTP
ncbi:MAG: DUF3667 domain-containing protein [Flavobacteriales bacterium]